MLPMNAKSTQTDETPAAAQHADVGEEISSDLAHDRRMRSDRLCGISGTRGRRMLRDNCTVCCSRIFVEEGAMM